MARGRAGAVTRGSLPSLLTGTLRVFVGRDRELGRLGRMWKEASAGELRVAFLAGEPGVGKTRLAAQLVRQVHGEDATVLAGTCGEDLGVPYQPFVEALRHFIDHSAADQLTSRLGRYPGESLAPDDWVKQTDCAQWDVRAMAGHTTGMLVDLHGLSHPDAPHPHRLRRRRVHLARSVRHIKSRG